MRKVNGRFVGQLKTPMFGVLRLKNDGTISSAEVASTNKQTPLQMAHRLLWSNIIANYRVLKVGLREGWEDIPVGQSLFNQFISVNSRTQPYALTRSDFKDGACIVAPYQITRGTLDPIKVDSSAGVPWSKTNIAVGSLTIDSHTTVGQLAEAIVTNNADWRYGDKLTYFSLAQYVKDAIPRVAMSYSAVTLVEDSPVIVADEVSLHGLKNVGGFIGHDQAAPVGGFCWVHSRRDADNSLLLSTQKIITNNDALIARYTTVEARLTAAESYGANFRDLVVLEPADDRTKEAYRYFGIRFNDAQGQTKLNPTDVSITGMTYCDRFVFDGDLPLAINTANSVDVVLSGSNFGALNTDNVVVLVNGTEIKDVQLKDNDLSLKLPESLNGQQITRVIVTDGTVTAAIDLVG